MYYVGMHGGSKPVRDNNRGATDRKFAEAPQPVSLGPGIEGTGGLVKNNDRRPS